MSVYILYILLCALSAVVLIETVYILATKKVQAGTLHIDTSRDSKIVCLFTLDLPIEFLEKKKKVIVKIDAKSNLKEWEH